MADWVECYALAKREKIDYGVALGLTVVAEDSGGVVHDRSARVQMSKTVSKEYFC